MSGGRGGARPATGGIALVAGVVLLALTIMLVFVGAVLLFGGAGVGRFVWGLPGVQVLWALGFSLAGYPITRRHPANPVGWCLMVAGVASALNLLGLELGGTTVAAGLEGPALRLVNAWVVSVGALSTAVVVFPSGFAPSRWWRVQLVVLWGSGFLVFLQDPYEDRGFSGPLGWLNSIAVPVDIVFQLSLAAGFFSLLMSWRRSGVEERSQLKWVVYGVALVAITAVVVEVGIAILAPAWYFSGSVALSLFILAIPATMGVAMLRYRLYDIDVVINRTLVYGTLTASLVFLYVGGVVALQYVFRIFAGEGSQLAVVASTLLIAALFTPLRHRFQFLIDRRFYRRKYDAAKTLSSFSARLRDETDLKQLDAELLSVVRATVQPAHVSFWLAPVRGERDD